MSAADLIARIDAARGDQQRANDLIAEARDRYKPPEPPPPPPEEGLLDKLKGADWSAIGHTALDFAGFIPGVGVVADLTNAALYAAEGDYVNAGLSAVSAVPGIGDAAAAAKIAAKAAIAGGGGAAVTFASRRMLRTDLNDSLRGTYPIPQGTAVGTPPRELLNNGRLRISELMEIVPSGTKNKFFPSERLPHGVKYQFRSDGVGHEVKLHQPDPGAPSGSNSANGWTAQIRIGNRYLKRDGSTTSNKTDNEVHIPLDE